MLLIGCLAIAGDRGNSGAKWAQSVIMLLWVFAYDLTIGPIAYCESFTLDLCSAA